VTAAPLASNRVGRTRLEVTGLGLGGATFGGVAAVETPAALAVVERACAVGIRYFDTAPQYGYGKSEHIVGDVLRGHSGNCVSTKVGRLLRPLHDVRAAGDIWHRPLPFEPVYDYSYDGIMRSHEDSLQRLGLDHVDALFIHDPDVYVRETGQDQKAFRAAVESAYRALDTLRSGGTVTAIGIGVNDAQPILDSLDLGQWDMFMLAGRYTLLEQAPLHTLLPAVERHGASVVIAGPFNSGIRDETRGIMPRRRLRCANASAASPRSVLPTRCHCRPPPCSFRWLIRLSCRRCRGLAPPVRSTRSSSGGISPFRPVFGATSSPPG